MTTRNPTGTVHVVDPSPYNWLHVLFNSMEEPVRADKAGRVTAALATSAKWINKTTLKMELRKGVTYHNGEKFTANTVIKNFTELQKWAAPHPAGTWLNFPLGTKLSVVDDHTIKFHFPKPDGLAIGKMRGNHMANEHFYRKLGFGYTKLGTGQGHWGVLDAPGKWGTGPFILSKGYSSLQNVPAFSDKKSLGATWLTVKEERTPFVVLESNRNYWNKKRGPRLSSVVFRNDLSAKEALHLCTTMEGQVDIVTQVDPKDARRVLGSRFAKLVTEKGNQVLAGVFNRFKQDVDFNDRNLRLALNLAVDREELVRSGFYGYADEVAALTPAWAADNPKDVTPRAYDPKNARIIMNKTNYPVGRKLKLAATGKYASIAKLLAKQIQGALHIGVEVKIIPDNLEINWMRILAEKKLVPSWDILLASATALFYDDTPSFFHRELFGESGALRAGPELTQFNQLYQRMAAEVDKRKRVEIAKEIDRYVFKEALALFLCVPQALYAVNKQVQFQPYTTTFELAETEVTQDHWSRRTYPGRA